MAAAHGASLIERFAWLYPSSGKENTFAESTLDLDNNGRKWFCGLARFTEASGTVTVRGPFSLP
jgi:hypothetical protein